jgi:hypothetical protein
VAVASQAAKGDETAAPISAKGGGRWKGNAFTVQGRAESPLELRDADSPYRIDARATAGATRAHARGTRSAGLRDRPKLRSAARTWKTLSADRLACQRPPYVRRPP